jgi:hypothetical protein
MSGGVPWITLPAGYLGSSFIGAALIACGFDTVASKIACLVLAFFFLICLWWARRNLLYASVNSIVRYSLELNIPFPKNVGPDSRSLRVDRWILVHQG